MPDVYVRSYFANHTQNYDIAPGYFARDAWGYVITDLTTVAGLNKSAQGKVLNYYTSPTTATDSRISINSALVLPSPTYLSDVAAAGARYGQYLQTADDLIQQGQDPSAASLAAAGELAKFAPKVGAFDPQYPSATGQFFPAFTVAGNVGVGVFLGLPIK